MTYRKKNTGARRIILRLFLVVIETILLLAAGTYAMAYCIYNGPSETFRNLLVRSLNETSAAGFVNELFLSPEELNTIINPVTAEEIIETDTGLVTITVKHEEADNGENEVPIATDAWGLSDEDGDGLILCPIKGEGYTGYMLVVLDPSRVILGAVPSDFEIQGYTVEQMVKYYDAVAGINAGGFYDPDGNGDGSIPDSLIVFNGSAYYGSLGSGVGFAGFDGDHVLHVSSKMTEGEAAAAGIKYGVCFGPVLIANGKPVDPDVIISGLNPRTAIGQRSDGAVLMLVIDGRQALSIGASLTDLQSIMLKYGAVNACNLDGGSSSMMWYKGEYINNCASVIGIRPVPTAFLVLKEGAKLFG